MDSDRKYFPHVIWIFFFLVILFPGCANEKPPSKDQVMAYINDFILTRNEFESKLAEELEYNRRYKATDNAKKEFLASLIKKEILIQEAVRQGLDKQRPFTQAIEQYWEATLIKNLMENKMNALRRKTFVSENEINEHYRTLKTQNPTLPPLAGIEKDISEQIREEKLTAAVEKWVTGLKQKADIKINSSNL